MRKELFGAQNFKFKILGHVVWKEYVNTMRCIFLSEIAWKKMVMSYFYTQTSSVLEVYITLESHFTFKTVFLLESGLTALDTTSDWNAQGLYFLGWHWKVVTHLYYNEDYSLIYSTNVDSAFIFMPALLWALGLQWSTRQKRLLPSRVCVGYLWKGDCPQTILISCPVITTHTVVINTIEGINLEAW